MILLAATWLLHPAKAQQWSNGSGGSIYYSGGNVGIGTTSPAAFLHIAGANIPFRLTGNGGWWTGIQFENAALSTTPVRWAMYNGVLGNPGDQIAFYNYALGRDVLTLTSAGNVGIGTIAPAYPLSVSGIIQAKEVLVNTGWSDYVFLPNYRLRPLQEVAAYIQRNHHLPDVPSEGEVREKGISLGQMQAKLLAKIEELTLHAIREDERNTRLEHENQDLQQSLTAIKAELARIDRAQRSSKSGQ